MAEFRPLSQLGEERLPEGVVVIRVQGAADPDSLGHEDIIGNAEAESNREGLAIDTGGIAHTLTRASYRRPVAHPASRGMPALRLQRRHRRIPVRDAVCRRRCAAGRQRPLPGTAADAQR